MTWERSNTHTIAYLDELLDQQPNSGLGQDLRRLNNEQTVKSTVRAFYSQHSNRRLGSVRLQAFCNDPHQNQYGVQHWLPCPRVVNKHLVQVRSVETPKQNSQVLHTFASRTNGKRAFSVNLATIISLDACRMATRLELARWKSSLSGLKLLLADLVGS